MTPMIVPSTPQLNLFPIAAAGSSPMSFVTASLTIQALPTSVLNFLENVLPAAISIFRVSG